MSAEVSCYVAVGSNLQRARSIRQGMDLLREAFGALRCSTIYETPAVGFEGPAFWNLVVELRTREPVTTVAAILRRIEAECGRDEQARGFVSRTLDLDLLRYGDLCREQAADGVPALPHADILKYDFVLAPLAELTPEWVHPVNGERLDTLWRERRAASDATSASMTRVSLEACGDDARSAPARAE
ncbi:MAG: 2-amino-4-hydroxy-6-hydroxymethyldihydropteridine diphosphokinase [Gammaproteobacteria bacterium]|nr:2-amino-4-hydroxy-6-hydroxymethyldihydropteridine diphosphokinase [Gammaproteobacteria bacterium]